MQPQIHNEAELIGGSACRPQLKTRFRRFRVQETGSYAMQSFACIFCAAAPCSSSLSVRSTKSTRSASAAY